VKKGLKSALRQLYLESRLAWASRGSQAAFRKLERRSGLKVHLGCGPDVRPGWLNIDLRARNCASPASQVLFINHDLRQGLPLRNGSCALIYSSHFLEHLDEATGENLLRDCFNALQSGGILRTVLPDMCKIFQAYLSGNRSFFQLLDDHRLVREGLGGRALVDYVNYAVYQYGEHKTMYNFDKLSRVLSTIGFDSVIQSAFSEKIDISLDLRRAYSLYVEARK
jgi:predicted SAM-dependent methyltransferase